MLINKLVSLIISIYKDVEVMGYTTRHWMGGNSFKAWTKVKLQSPGRTNDLLHIHHTSFPSIPYPLKENVDGEAILSLCHPSKLNILISDNTPADYTTTKLNTLSLLTNHMILVCKTLSSLSLKLFKINISPNHQQQWFNVTKTTSPIFSNTLIDNLTKSLFNIHHPSQSIL